VIVDWKVFALVFGTVFIAELGDKTQLATLLFAADKDVNKWLVFAGASLALIATSALGVLGGTLVSQYVSERTLHVVAGVGFIVIGIWTLWR
jgi:putative Ca2+/H+ antiporter (TMEM165/GDT1 family)